MASGRVSKVKGKIVDLPNIPTIGTATRGIANAQVTFTAPTGPVGPVNTYALLSNPGSVTATGASSPIKITGLTNNTAYTFTVRANNASGSGSYSSASNSVTPANLAKATGGTIYDDTTYVYHVFTSNATFTPTTSLSADIIVVAGGGGGSRGGGGAGGLCYQAGRSFTATGYSIVIGAGGAGSNNGNAGNGTNTTFDGITALGGGGGRGQDTDGVSGGSGGGASGAYDTRSGGAATQGNSNGATGYGNRGGNGSYYYESGGGGGAGAAGGDSVQYISGPGGIGLTNSVINTMGAATGFGEASGSNYYFAGGGGGRSQQGPNSLGGLGGGGYNSGNGLPNSGGGGGGGSGVAGTGAAGIVIVRYLA